MNTYKVILLGQCYVGKSSIINRYIYNTFHTNIQATIGASYYTKMAEKDGKVIKLNIWDCCGNEKFNIVLPTYYKSTNIILIVYDITSVSSYNKCKFYIEDVKRNVENPIIILVGNKSDLYTREISYEDGLLMANANNVYFYECSAYNGENINNLFQFVISKLTISLPKAIQLNEVKNERCCQH